MDKDKAKLVAGAAIASLLTIGAQSAVAGSHGAKEKCYGIAAAGANDCGNIAGTHGCAGQYDAAKHDKAGEWIYLPKGVCSKIGGGTLKK